MTRKQEAPPALQHLCRARAPASRSGGVRRSPGRRGAAGAADRRHAGRGDDADARPRRGARARLRALGGAAAACGSRAGRSRRQHDRARGTRFRPRAAGTVVLHDVVVRRLRQGRARGDRRRGAAGREHAHDRRSAVVATAPRQACARPRRRSPRPAGSMRPGSSRQRARSSAPARTSAGTTRWTR